MLNILVHTNDSGTIHNIGNTMLTLGEMSEIIKKMGYIYPFYEDLQGEEFIFYVHCESLLSFFNTPHQRIGHI